MSPQDLEPTGERLIPEHRRGELVYAEHLARYRLAAQLAPGRRVLDVACGEGYGTSLLASARATSIVGADIDAATVEHVRSQYGLEAHEADIRSLPFEDEAFDLVVSFETIEHVEDPERALDELARVLGPDGLMLISTPNASQSLVENEFHVREFGHREFVTLLRERFSDVRLLFQHNWLTSAVLDETAMTSADGTTSVPLDLTKVKGVPVGDELYLLALCGDRVEAVVKPVGVLAGTDEAHELARRLVDAERAAERWHQEFERAKHRAEETFEQARVMRESSSWRLTAPLRRFAALRRRS
jgi:2-polyprenyl-3-methyl-5-hydroxy-6-metoxy-1,4-benzoquinol methylase